MYKKEKKKPETLPGLEEFKLPFSGKLDSRNKWVVLSKIIPWEKIEEKYERPFSNEGAPAKTCRIALGALIIKERLNLSDRDTVEQIMENPYLQYFIGLKQFEISNPPFDPSMIVLFRKRFDEKTMMEINEMIASVKIEDKSEDKNDKTDNGSGQTKIETEKKENKEEIENSGEILLDATCTPSDITYPTDLNLLNEGREKTEEIIDILYKENKKQDADYKKPRTYREKARREYLKTAKGKKHSKKTIRKALRKQLGFLGRNIKRIGEMLDFYEGKYPGRPFPFTKIQMKNYWVIQTMYEQQKEMYLGNKNSIDHRIVSITQPHVRPILRGKKNASTEFGAKVSISVVKGLSYVEEMSWDNFNEGLTLQESVEKYKKRFGFYPKAVIADKIYRNKDNLKYCKERNIRLSGPKLGRPNQETAAEEKLQEYKDSGLRNSVEAKFGEGKRFYGLDRIMSKLKETAETEIMLQFVVMNLEQKLRILFCKFLEKFILLINFRNRWGFSRCFY